MHGFYRIACAVPEMRVADVSFNLKEICRLAREADGNRASLAVFPELCITGYTCGDLFQQSRLLDAVQDALLELAESTSGMDMLILVGAPLYGRNALYNCAVAVHKGRIIGAVPKTFIPNYREYYEKRWFTEGEELELHETRLGDQNFHMGTRILFEIDNTFRVGVEICEDLWNVLPPSSRHAAAGATVIANLSASNEFVGKTDYRKELVRHQSARCIAAYAYSSSGVWESSTDLLFSGHAMIAENGVLLAENERFKRDSGIIYSDVDCRRLLSTRLAESSFPDNHLKGYEVVNVPLENRIREIRREFEPYPFVPRDESARHQRCREIICIQSSALARRLEHIGAEKAVIGISGGLDSTHALMVVEEAFKLTQRRSKDIIGVTMPGFGTGGRTYANAVKLCEILKVDFREIDIKDACTRHFEDIGQDPQKHDTTFENVQARERTQLLMDIANREKGLVIGTGDLSELALGWATYNGDHMSMYTVNCGVPKTLIRYLIKWIADHSDSELEKLLYDISDTPVSPELLPNKGKSDDIHHRTEDILGAYDMHDFFLYHTVKYGAEPGKILYMAEKAFDGIFAKEEIERALSTFTERFFSQQFKRSCLPDGPKVGSICLSPRGDWRMPSDASGAEWKK